MQAHMLHLTHERRTHHLIYLEIYITIRNIGNAGHANIYFINCHGSDGKILYT